jgi:hypothetical protein
MTERQPHPEDEETPSPRPRDEKEWSRWERQKLEVYERAHPSDEPEKEPADRMD